MRVGTVGIVLCALAIAIVFVFLLVKLKSGPGRTGARFKARSFMTPNELEFLGRLEVAVPELRFHAQVAMGALLAPGAERRGNSREYMSARGRFSQKIVDFVAQHRSTGDVVAVIELDDRTHDPAKDESRDAMLRGANYRIVRWQSKSKPNGAAIRQALLAPSGEGGGARLDPALS